MGSLDRITEEQRIETPQVHLKLDKKFIGSLKKSSTTPDVENVEDWNAINTAPVTVTNFLNGQDGQHLYILGDGNTTLQHGTKIFLRSGANLLLDSAKLYHLQYRSGKWYQVVVST